MKTFAKVINGRVRQYPYLAKEADTDSGVFPTVLNKPETFCDEDEVWTAPTFEILGGVVYVTLTKRDKTNRQKTDRASQKRAERTQELADMDEVFEAAMGLIKANKFSKEQLSEIITTLRSVT